jgi:ketosteroid isomerase-like protein
MHRDGFAARAAPTTNHLRKESPMTRTELLRNVYAAFATGDIPTVLGALAPDVRWVEPEGFPYAGTFIGPQAVLEGVFMRIGADWATYTCQPHEYHECADTVFVLGDYDGTHRASGNSFHAPFVHVWRFDGDHAKGFASHTDTALVQRAT